MKCPYCAEEIQPAAVKCKHCGEWLIRTQTPSAEQLNKSGVNYYKVRLIAPGQRPQYHRFSGQTEAQIRRFIEDKYKGWNIDDKYGFRLQGSTHSGSTKFCFVCSQEIDFSSKICPKCGTKQPLQKTQGERSRLVAALFAIFLGSLGIHKFYLGQIGWGVVYLIFCWTFIPWIVGFIEGIIYLTMSDAEFAKKYG